MTLTTLKQTEQTGARKKLGHTTMKNKVIRREHTNLNGGKSKTHHRVTVIINGSLEAEETFSSKRAAQQYAREQARRWAVRIRATDTVRGVQYAHEL